MKILLTLFLTSFVFVACGQAHNSKGSQAKKTETDNMMDLSKITSKNVQNAIKALQQNDKTTWYSYFTKDATFTDDGREVDFKSFFDNAFAKKERFLDIEKVTDDGTYISGNFFAGQWGTFRVYFKFHQNKEGKFDRLDIGQARK